MVLTLDHLRKRLPLGFQVQAPYRLRHDHLSIEILENQLQSDEEQIENASNFANEHPPLKFPQPVDFDVP
jgi:hypothetical protein